jgi:NADP-dependent 3-hydroxy acid dehydrogenase YdfG
MTKWGVGVLSEALRQEITKRFVRVAVVEPGATATEITAHMRPAVAEVIEKRSAGIMPLDASDVAEAIVWIVTRRRDVAINEVLVRPTTQV